MNKSNKKQEFIKEQKQAATIKVKTLVIGLIWFATIIGAFIGGWSMRSDFAREVRAEVKSQMVVVETQSKDQK